MAAAAVGLLAATAGAGALNELGTGVPVVDELLEVEAPSLMDEPAGDATEPLPVPTNDGTAQSVAYLSRHGTICQVEAERHPRIEGSVRGGGGGCLPAADMARLLDRHGVRWAGSSHGPERRVFHGFADGDVREHPGARGGGRSGGPDDEAVDAAHARRRAAAPLRGDRRARHRRGRRRRPARGASGGASAPVEVTYADGRTERIEAPY